MNNDLKPYQNYKDINLQWNAKVPDHWNIVRGKVLFNNKKQLNKNNECANILSLTLRGVVNNNINNPEGLVPKDYNTYQIFEKDDLVFKLIDLENYKTSRVGLVHEKGAMSPAYIRLTNRRDINVKYFYYQYYDLYLRGVYNRLGAGVRSTLNASDLLNIYIVEPTRMEQDQIVKYLDVQLARINKLIQTKKKIIVALKEQKQVIINNAVSKGLNPNTKMKQSGIEWIGDIPENWETIRCKYLFREIDLRSTTGEETHLSMSQKYGLIPDNQLTERRLLSESYVGGKVCFKDDLVLNRLKAHLGVFALAPQTGVVSPDYTVLRPNERVYPEFAEMVLKSQKCRNELRVRVRGIVEGFWRLYTDDFYTIVLPIPKLEEQAAILDYIKKEFSSIDLTIQKIEKEINLITEYRIRLISDVVTGKVDVRNIPIDGVYGDDLELKIDDFEDENETEEVEDLQEVDA